MLHTSPVLILEADRSHGSTSTYVMEALLEHGVRFRELVPISLLLEVPGVVVPDDAIWALRAVPGVERPERDRLARLFACDCAHVVLLHERDRGRNPAPAFWHSVSVARRYVAGGVSSADLQSANCDAELSIGVDTSGSELGSELDALAAAASAALPEAWKAAYLAANNASGYFGALAEEQAAAGMDPGREQEARQEAVAQARDWITARLRALLCRGVPR